MSKKGFTLIELLVVISIIAVLAGLLVPGILKAMKQAKSNRALSEMQHLATVLSQVYNEVGYYVRLEDLAKSDTSQVYVWEDSTDYAAGVSDDEIIGTTYGTQLNTLTTANFWAGPYLTYKDYVQISSGYRPIDPWGKTSDPLNAQEHQLRMFWTTSASVTPAGATGAMVIISAGPDKIYRCGINSNPENAELSNFQNFNPNSGVYDPIENPNGKGDDVYFIFNAGIQ